MGPLWLLTLLPGVIGQALISVLKGHEDTLGTLNFYIANSRTLTTLLSAANNFTFLAPSNEAFDEWLINKGSTPPSADEIDAILAYHLLHGGFPTVAFTTNPHFVPTNLTDSRFTNVTTGQTVELQLAQNGAQFVSGNKSVSTVKLPDIVCTGGIIHIVNSVLRIPPGLVTLLTQSNLNFFIGILNQGGYLNAASQPLVRPVLDNPNNTIFAPNTAAALSTFKSRTKNASQQELDAVFNYHVVPNFLGYSTSLQDGMVLKTDEGSDLYITVRGNDTFVNSAKIITSDFLVSNGVLHTIDGLLDRFNTTRPTAVGEPSSSATPAPPSSKSRLSTGAKAGIGVGVVLAVSFSAISFLLVRWLQRRRRAADNNIRSPPMELSGPLMVQELDSRRKTMYGSKSELGAGSINAPSDKSLEPVGFAVELDATERRERSGSRPRNFV